MKIRNGFVSNSSSSSFVICKEYLTDKQLQSIREAHDKWEKEDQYFGDGGSDLTEDRYYISFDVHGIYREFDELCCKNGIDKNKMFWIER